MYQCPFVSIVLMLSLYLDDVPHPGYIVSEEPDARYRPAGT